MSINSITSRLKAPFSPNKHLPKPPTTEELHQAIKDNAPIASFITPQNINAYELGFCAIHIAILENNPDLLRQLIEAGADRETPTEREQCSPLFLATLKGSNACLPVLLNQGTSTTEATPQQRKNGQAAFLFAAKKGDLDALTTLFNAGIVSVNATSGDISPLFCAAQFGNVECVNFLLANGALV